MKSSRSARPAYFCPSLLRCTFDLQTRSKCDEKGRFGLWPKVLPLCLFLILGLHPLTISGPFRELKGASLIVIIDFAVSLRPRWAETSGPLLLLQLLLVCRVLV